MAVLARAAFLALMGLCVVGCETIPGHQIPDTYPASGPVGIRMGATFQNNFPTDVGIPYEDASGYWEQGYGFTFELPVDVNPYWGGFFGMGYEYFDGKSDTLPDGSTLDMDSISLLPIYIGLTGRIPFWLDEKKYEEEPDPVWIPSDPIGFAPYVRGAVGGAVLLNSPDATNSVTGDDMRALDYQIFPFFDGAAGVEYREKSVGYWAELGYRLYLIPDRETGPFGSDRMARMQGLRAMVGLTWYLW
jgi:hypothetical protein